MSEFINLNLQVWKQPSNNETGSFEFYSVKEISTCAFKGCVSLKQITIPKKFSDNIKDIFRNVNVKKVQIIYT